jgi:hypothetical protein
MSMIKTKAIQILTETLAQEACISSEAAEDVVERVQELIWEHRGGSIDYPSEEAILDDFRINRDYLWCFD